MKHVIVTATDTGESVIIRGALTSHLAHAIALAWVRPAASTISQDIAAALGPRKRARRYAIDRSDAPGLTIHFSPYKRPETLTYRGAPCGFVRRHALPAKLSIREVMTPVAAAGGLVLDQTPPECAQKNPPLIILEGPDGTGKSTLAASLRDYYNGFEELHAHLIRDPGGTHVGERLREMVLDPELEMSQMTQMFTFLAARAEMLAEAAYRLSTRQIVILDRCWISTLAYQAWGQGMGEDIVLDTAKFQLEKVIPPLTPILYVTLSAPR